MNNNYLEIINLNKYYGRRKGLENVNLTLVPGRIVGLLGPDGSGKTTLFKLIMHIIRQQYGTIKICGEDVKYETRKYISYMPDREFLYNKMKIKDAMKYYQDMFPDFNTNRFVELLKYFQLEFPKEIDKLPKEKRDQVLLALTLSRNVPIYLLDEPLFNLEPEAKLASLGVIKQTLTPNNLIILSTHFVKSFEGILDEIIFLKSGNVVFHCLKDDIFRVGKSVEQCYLEVFKNV